MISKFKKLVPEKYISAIKSVVQSYRRIKEVEEKLAQLIKKFEELERQISDHINNYHVDVEEKYLKLKNNILWNTKISPPEACCLHCHDSKHFLSRMYLTEGYYKKDDEILDKYECRSCGTKLTLSHSNTHP